MPIDTDVGDTFWILSLFSKGWWSIALLILAIVAWLIAGSNEIECKKAPCPTGTQGRLIKRECLCVAVPLNTHES